MTVSRARLCCSAILVAGIAAGCSRQSPTAPTPATTTVTPAPGPAQARSSYGIVIDEAGVCISGAVVEVIAGQGAGQKSAQAGPCDHWWPFNGFTFSNLTPGVSLTLRAAAPGHIAKEMVVQPSLQPVEFVLEPVR